MTQRTAPIDTTAETTIIVGSAEMSNCDRKKASRAALPPTLLSDHRPGDQSSHEGRPVATDGSRCQIVLSTQSTGSSLSACRKDYGYRTDSPPRSVLSRSARTLTSSRSAPASYCIDLHLRSRRFGSRESSLRSPPHAAQKGSNKLPLGHPTLRPATCLGAPTGGIWSLVLPRATKGPQRDFMSELLLVAPINQSQLRRASGSMRRRVSQWGNG